MAEPLFSDEFQKLVVRALVPGGAAATQCEQPFFDTELIKQIYRSAQEKVKHPAYYYANIPTYPGGGIGFMYISDTTWENGLKTPYPPGVNKYINPEIHKAAFALPEFFRKNCMDDKVSECELGDFYLYRFIVPTRYYQIDCIELIMNSTTESLYTENAASVRTHRADARGAAPEKKKMTKSSPEDRFQSSCATDDFGFAV